MKHVGYLCDHHILLLYLYIGTYIVYLIVYTRWVVLCVMSWDVIKWKHFPCYWPFVRGIRPSPVHSPHKGQWRGALMFSLICAWINGWVNNREAGGLWRHRVQYDVIVMFRSCFISISYIIKSSRESVPWCALTFLIYDKLILISSSNVIPSTFVQS